jgi:hypothetical protein
VLGERTTSVLTDADVDPRARAESLGLPEWAALVNAEAAS